MAGTGSKMPNGTSGAQASAKNSDLGEALYLYGIADGNLSLRIGKIGIGGADVYTIPCQRVSAIVHDSLERPYESKDAGIVEGWIREHEKVLEFAMEKFESGVVPFRFNTIIRSENHSTPSVTLRKWIIKELPDLRKKMKKIKARREYGVQILYSLPAMTRKVMVEQNDEKKLSSNQSSKGTDYMYKLKMEKTVRKELETRASSCFKDFYTRLSNAAAEVKVERTRAVEKDLAMLMNLSVLADDTQSRNLGSCLEKIKEEGFIVRFTGPWPPYSFV